MDKADGVVRQSANQNPCALDHCGDSASWQIRDINLPGGFRKLSDKACLRGRSPPRYVLPRPDLAWRFISHPYPAAWAKRTITLLVYTFDHTRGSANEPLRSLTIEYAVHIAQDLGRSSRSWVPPARFDASDVNCWGLE
jgi:hypothetical protein